VSERFQVGRLSDMALPNASSESRWLGIRQHFDIRSFGVNAWSSASGVQVINEHDEVPTGHEELYVVIEGRATFTVDGEELDAPAGTAVFVRDPAARRGAVATEDGTTILTVGGRPGEAFTISPWERSAPALVAFAAEDYEEAFSVLLRLHEETPDDATVLYNLACAESLTGRADEAIGHLRRAIDADPDRFRELARTDTDFDPIRDDARFAEL
jgi:tetratricopeptide (TPR) repeat protein